MSKRKAIGQGERSELVRPNWWQMGASKRWRNQFSSEYPRGSEVSKRFYGNSYKEANRTQKDARKMTRFKGPGDYKALYRKYRKYVPRALGAAGAYGLGYGAGAGWNVGARASKAIGWGDYSLNQIVSGQTPTNPNQNVHHVSTVSSDLSGDILYSNTEFVSNIYATIVSGSSAFKVDSFPINPALSHSFPFLSQIAQNFELYEFMGLMFQYKPTSGEFGSNNSNALGKVVLCTNYDPDASAFGSSIVMENYDYACSTKPSGSCIHGVECKPSQRSTNQLYTRASSASKDKVFTDLGTFQIASEGIPSSVAQDVLIGELWVTYTVKLTRAKLDQAIGNTILHAVFQGSLGTDLGAKTWTPDSDNTILAVAGTPTGHEVQFVDVDSTTVQLVFGPAYQNKRVIITNYSVTIASTFAIILNTAVNCTVIHNNASYQGTSHSTSALVLDFDDQYTGTASIYLDGQVAPGASQIDSLAISIVDPQFSTRVDS